MVDKDIVMEKVGNIQNCLKRIKEVTQNNPETLDDLNVQDMFVLNLQRAIQSAIDLGAHVVSSEGLGLPDKLKEIFVILKNAKIIGADLSKKMISMVGFRNIAVHEYSEVLKKILAHHVADVETFCRVVVDYFKLA